MPVLRQLMQKGASGNIATLNPPLSPMLWTSIATSKRAYDHGIKGFVEVDTNKGEVRPVRATSRQVKAFWSILNEAGLKTNVINWWPSHPAERLNGICVSNAFHQKAPAPGEEWPLDRGAVFPEGLRETLKNLRLHPSELTLAHIEPFVPRASELDPETDKVLKPLMRVLAHCSSVHNAVTWAMENSEWDVTAVYYEAIDHFSHLAMKYHPPRQEGVDHEEFEHYKGVVEAAYRFHDMMLERLLSLAGEDCHLLLVSDHGFESGQLRTLELPDVPAAPALEHRKYGILLAAGPDFRTGEKIYGASLLDVTPTILHLFDLPIGEDMEGTARLDLWKSPQEVSYIPTWEGIGRFPAFLSSEQVSDQVMMKELEDMGYIDLPSSDKVMAVKQELAYNLCVSLVDGNHLDKALQKARMMYGEYGDGRTAMLLADILLKKGDYEELETLLGELAPFNSQNPQYIFLQALLYLYTGRRTEALLQFKDIEAAGAQSVQLYNEIGKALLLSGQTDEAFNYFQKSLQLDAENATALTSSGQCYIENGKYPEALESLEASLQNLFYQPHAHYLMAVCLFKMDKRKDAITALNLCLHQAPKHQKARVLLNELIESPAHSGEPVIIVSGLPRSGTSLMMQMLQAGGVEVVSDHTRSSDLNNPQGYLEDERVKRLGIDAEWMPEARGKCVKVVSQLLRYLPATERYRIIRMQRPLTEVVVSQRVMMGQHKQDIMRNFPFQHAANLQREEEQMTVWLSHQPNVSCMEVAYHDCLQKPEEVMSEVAAFLGENIDVHKAAEKVDLKLYRNILGK